MLVHDAGAEVRQNFKLIWQQWTIYVALSELLSFAVPSAVGGVVAALEELVAWAK